MNCFGDHAWVLIGNPESVYQPVMQCTECGMVQRYYSHNQMGRVGISEFVMRQLYQQGFNIRVIDAIPD